MPETEPGRSVVTPIKVSHALLAEVFFSVYGEDEKGKPMTRPGAGGLKILRINRPVLVSSVSKIVHNYGQVTLVIEIDQFSVRLDASCRRSTRL
jgi:hypothetical protein